MEHNINMKIEKTWKMETFTMTKYFGGDTPFEEYEPLYQIKQKEGRVVSVSTEWIYH